MGANKELVEKFKPLVKDWDCYWDTALPDEDVTRDATACASIAEEYAREVSVGVLNFILKEFDNGKIGIGHDKFDWEGKYISNEDLLNKYIKQLNG